MPDRRPVQDGCQPRIGQRADELSRLGRGSPPPGFGITGPAGSWGWLTSGMGLGTSIGFASVIDCDTVGDAGMGRSAAGGTTT